MMHPVISPDGKWLALPLTRRVCHQHLGATDVGRAPAAADRFWPSPHLHRAPRVVVGGRQAVFAAVGEGDADVVLLRGLGTNFR